MFKEEFSGRHCNCVKNSTHFYISVTNMFTKQNAHKENTCLENSTVKQVNW